MHLQVWNPSFDVAPGRLIAGIVTEKGVIPKKGEAHDVRSFLASLGLYKLEANGPAGEVNGSWATPSPPPVPATPAPGRTSAAEGQQGALAAGLCRVCDATHFCGYKV